MPEKPEVITVANSLKKLILNKKITGCNIYWDNIIAYPVSNEFKKKIIGQKIESINTRGKWIVIDLDKDSLLVHLRMEGKFMFRDKGEVIGKHEHVEVNDVKPLNEIGLEYYDSKLTKEYLYEAIHGKRLPIKTVLLDQSIIAGIGNIYDDEILFMSGIHPLRKACDVSLEECEKIINNTKIVLDKAVKLGGTTIRSFTSSEGVHGLFQNELLVHGNGGNSCPTCGRIIEKNKVGGRGTYFCSDCQK